MRMDLRAGAFALAMMGAVCFGNVAPAAAQNVILTEGKISQLNPRSAMRFWKTQLLWAEWDFRAF